MEDSIDIRLEDAVLVVENDELEWDDDSIAIMGIPEEAKSVSDITEETACLVNDRENEDEDLARLVFTNEKILESIISKVLYYHHPHKPIHFRSTIQRLRLVSKPFLQAITKLLRQKKEILFYLTLDKTNSLNSAPLVMEECGKSLDNFVHWIYPNSLNSCSWYKEHRPIFALKIMEEFFQKENHHSLLHCLKKCGNDLQKLEIFLPRNLFKVMFPPYKLPALEELTVHLGGPIVDTIFVFSMHSMNSTSEYDDNVFRLINSLLIAGSGIKRLKLENIKTQKSEIKNDLNCKFILPESIIKLELYLIMTTRELEILLENSLPNLSSLKLALPDGTLCKQTKINFLDPFRTTLQELQIVEFGEKFPCPAIHFPVMEKLKSLEFSAINKKLTDNATDLSSKFPALEKIHLVQCEADFCKWTEFARYDTVHTVELELVKEENGKRETMPISQENMKLLHYAFLNMTSLTIKMTDELKDGLQCLFREMRLLKCLKLCIVNTSVRNSDYWDALLIGVTEEQLGNLRENPEISVENNEDGSLCLLDELQELHLSATASSSEISVEDVSLISDLTFVHAFRKMPKLYKLRLQGLFSASDNMYEAWRNQCHRLFCNED